MTLQPPLSWLAKHYWQHEDLCFCDWLFLDQSHPVPLSRPHLLLGLLMNMCLKTLFLFALLSHLDYHTLLIRRSKRLDAFKLGPTQHVLNDSRRSLQLIVLILNLLIQSYVGLLCNCPLSWRLVWMRRRDVLYYFQIGGGLLPYQETHKTYIHSEKVQSIKDVLSHVLK